MSNQDPYEVTMTKKDGTTMSIAEYFNKQYNINLKKKQPMLFVNNREGGRTYLPSELCHEASLPEGFTRDAFKMSKIQNYKITSADERKKKILKLVQDFGLKDKVKIF